MTLHLIKLCVGAQSIEDLAEWQAANRRQWRKVEGRPCMPHTTFQTPKRAHDLLDGGSLYWVIKGVVQARQRILGLDDGHKEDGSSCCLLLLDAQIVAVRPMPRRAFQGWRYLEPDNAPPDISGAPRGDLAALPAQLRRDLAALCLI